MIGIIGFGRFGQLLYKYLADDFEVFVYDRDGEGSLDKVCEQKYIILAVPISEIENCLNEIKDKIKETTTVIDVCSVKEYPVELMKKILPKNQVLATHPMFGPDSAGDSLEGHKIVLCNVSLDKERLFKIKNYLKDKKLAIIESTPKEHDRQTAKSLVLTQLIGRSLVGLIAEEIKIDTKWYNMLREMSRAANNDSVRLFDDMSRYNKYAKKAREEFIESVKKINEKLQIGE